MLAALLCAPLLGALALYAVPRRHANWIKGITAAASGTAFLTSVALLLRLASDSPEAMAIRIPWLPFLGSSLSLAADGLALPFLALTTLLVLITTVASLGHAAPERGFFALILLFEAGVLGFFCARDLLLLVFFWQLSLFPLYFLMGIWGGEQGSHAGFKTLMLGLLTSAPLVLAAAALHGIAGTLDLDALKQLAVPEGALSVFGLSLRPDRAIWILLFAGFCGRLSLWPTHTWLPWAHSESPVTLSMLISGLFLKMGAYGILRVNFTVLPQASLWASSFMVWAGVAMLAYGALCAMAQRDLLRFLAFSSLAHMGLVLAGLGTLTPTGLNGAVTLMFHHGVFVPMLLLLGGLLSARVPHLWIVRPDGSPGFGGLIHVTPALAGFAALGLFAAIGIPGMGPFVGNVLVLLGMFQLPVFQPAAVGAAVGLLLVAAGYLWTYSRIFLGNSRGEMEELEDLDWKEKGAVLPLGALLLALGCCPQWLLSALAPPLAAILAAFV